MAPEAVAVSATIAATGLGVRYIGDDPQFAFSYSGMVASDNVETSLLDFHSQTGIIVGEFQPVYATEASNNQHYLFRVYFNNQTIYRTIVKDGAQDAILEIRITIPPLTHVKATAENVSDTTSLDMAAIITGRVYGV